VLLALALAMVVSYAAVLVLVLRSARNHDRGLPDGNTTCR
jgi:hypothetical protein